jgi:DNA-binding phage protein
MAQRRREAMAQPENRSEQAIRAYIEEYLDPDAHLRRDDDPALIVAQLDRVFADDGGCGVTVEEMARYLESLER